MSDVMEPIKKFHPIRHLFSYLPKGMKKWIKFNLLGETGMLVNESQLRPKMHEACSYLIKNFGKENFGDYLEFGVYNGTSLSIMHKVMNELNISNARLFGFDSFEGLPKEAASDDLGRWKPGEFHSTYKFTHQNLSKKGIDWKKTFLIKGWFSNTLNDNLIQKYNIKKASVIMVDCDLYSSTCDVLKFCAPLLTDRAFIIFDDWNSHQLAEKDLGEKKAFDEFLQSNPHFATEDFGSYCYRDRPVGQMFLVTNTIK